MPIAFPHFLRLVAHPGVNESLIDATGRTVGRERVAKGVPASELVPSTVLHGPLEMIVRFITSEWAETRPVDLATNDFKVLDEE